jgi:putative ABC transport system permease protein
MAPDVYIGMAQPLVIAVQTKKDMFKHHLLLIYRTFKRYKTSFFINLIGLSAGLTCALLIYLWVSDEVGMDKFHQKGKQLYQVMSNEITDQGIRTTDANAGILGEGIKAEMPEVEDALTTSPTSWLAQSKISVDNSAGIKARGKFAGENFFKIFSYRLLSGNINTVLSGTQSIAISEQLAKKLFHRTDVLGKVVVWQNAEVNKETSGIVTGVFENTPEQSSDQFDFLVSLDMLNEITGNFLKWTNYGPNTFILLKPGSDPEKLNARIKDYMQSKGIMNRKLFIRPYDTGYLYGSYENGVQAGGRIQYVQLFGLLAIFILVIACVNFMNLSTAKATRRMKEVGIKKVMGADRRALIFQYLGESMMLTVLSLFISLTFVELLLPQFNLITEKNLSLHFDARLIGILAAISIFTGLLSGSYPALYLSGFDPAQALKGKLMGSARTLWTRQGLVVFQFTLSIILIVSVFVIYKQIDYVQKKNLGYNKDNVIYLEMEGKLKNNVTSFLQAIKEIPGVKNAAGMDRSFLGEYGYTEGDFRWENRNPKQVIKFQHASVSEDLIETLGMKMAAGRSFSSKFGSDSSRVLINETGIRLMGLKNPVGKIFGLWGKDYQIVGVIKDFHSESLHEQVKPLFFRFNSQNNNRVLIRIEAGKVRETLDLLGDYYGKFNPGYSFDYTFLDQDFQRQYVSENRVALLSRYFAMLAVIISCLGLFGLASFTAERKLKEIGIRKVLGASQWNIIYMLSEEFMKPVLASIGIALPVSYIMTSYWLESFAYRIDLQVWYFVGSALIALVISWGTVGMQAISAARIDPVKCLRDE